MKLFHAQRWLVFAGVLAFLAMGLFPPWQYTNGRFAGYAFIGDYHHPSHVDLGRLALQWGLLLAIGAIATATAFRPKRPY